jgi:hypothetical protein
MRLLGLIRECAFSSVKMDRTLEGFHLLRQDLERFGSELLERDGDDFAKLAETAEEDMDRYRGFKALSRYERGDH